MRALWAAACAGEVGSELQGAVEDDTAIPASSWLPAAHRLQHLLLESKSLDAPLTRVCHTCPAALQCMVGKCGGQIFACMADSTCRTSLNCLSACEFNDQASRAGLGAGSPQSLPQSCRLPALPGPHHAACPLSCLAPTTPRTLSPASPSPCLKRALSPAGLHLPLHHLLREQAVRGVLPLHHSEAQLLRAAGRHSHGGWVGAGVTAARANAAGLAAAERFESALGCRQTLW